MPPRALQPTEPRNRAFGARQILDGVNLGYICFARFQERYLLYLHQQISFSLLAYQFITLLWQRRSTQTPVTRSSAFGVYELV